MGFIMRWAASRTLVTSAAQLSTGLPIRERLFACPVIVTEHTTCGLEAIPFLQNPARSRRAHRLWSRTATSRCFVCGNMSKIRA